MRIAVNGFGRIGRVFTRLALQNDAIEIVAINDLAENYILSHLFKYDSVHGTFSGEVEHTDEKLIVNGKEILTFKERNPEALPWKELNIDLVVESTGLFRTKKLAAKHLEAGAKQVIISAPAKGGDIKTICIGINDSILTGDEEIISNASCTTNSAAPLVKVMKSLATIESGYITTVHSYTNDQRLHDTPHTDLRRARAAATSIVPTTTGAAKAITKIFPELDGRLGGAGIRVPVTNGSLTDMNFVVKEDISIETINSAFKKAAEGELKGILQYMEDPIVSIDIINNSHSSIFDAELTSVVGKMVKVVGWYDNEYGYSNRLVDLVMKLKELKG